jgi:hypothetical protein
LSRFGCLGRVNKRIASEVDETDWSCRN